MGGSVHVAVRFKNGETVCQRRWTNNMTWWFKNPKMYLGDEEHVRAYVFGMIRNNDKIADDDTLGQPAKVENSSYGLVVWDYVTNSILDNNGYSSPDYFDTVYASGDHEEFNECANAGILYMEEFTYPPRDPNDRTPYKQGEVKYQRTANLSPADAMRLGAEAYKQKFGYRPKAADGSRTFVRFGIDKTPMTYTRFPEGEFKDYRAKLVELGFPMTQKEGLNKTLKQFWAKQRPVFGGSEQESHARSLYQDFKTLEENKAFDGVPFEELTPESQQKFMDSAAIVLGDPKLVRDFAIARLFGASSKVVTLTIGSE